MWFQDLFNYDFRRTERCIIPYATQEGEISFCAYNTGIGWRNIIEKMHMTATLTKWYEEHGRHEIFAGGKKVALSTTDHSLVLDPAAVAAGKQTDLDEAGIAKNAREEKLRARAAGQDRRSGEREDGRAVSPARAEGAADPPDPGPGREEEGRRAGSPARQAEDLSGYSVRVALAVDRGRAGMPRGFFRDRTPNVARPLPLLTANLWNPLHSRRAPNRPRPEDPKFPLLLYPDTAAPAWACR